MSEESENTESKFGFKDKEKALETLKLLESHELQYRKLTVRGLLGRAKRVLSMTKAEEKLKNINEAIEIFEKWLEENGGGAANKNAKTEHNDKVDTVPGLGFKDKEAAEKTLKILEGRDPEYQKLAVKGLIGSSKRVLSGTKNEEKIKCIKEGVQILEDFLEKFDKENLNRLNKAYLPYEIIKNLPPPGADGDDDDDDDDKLAGEFLETYGGEKAKGNYKHLRTLFPKDCDEKSWDIVRNQHLNALTEQTKKEDAKLFTETGEPSKIHLRMIHWAYSPQPDKVKSYVDNIKSKAAKRKSESNGDHHGDHDDDEVSPKKQKVC